MTAFQLIKTSFVVAALTLATVASRATAQAQTPAAATDAVSITMLLNAEKGASTDDAVNAMKDVGAYMRRQPGFIDGALLENTFPGNKPSHVYLSRWRALKDWEQLSASAEFLKLLDTKGKLFSWSAAEDFKPVK